MTTRGNVEESENSSTLAWASSAMRNENHFFLSLFALVRLEEGSVLTGGGAARGVEKNANG